MVMEIKKKINRTRLIPYSFPKELVEKKSITLKTPGEQFRNFCFNEDLGLIIQKWLLKKNKKSIVTNINGAVTLKVHEFARLCIQIYKLNFNKEAYLKFIRRKKVNKSRKLIVNQLFKKKFSNKLNDFILDYLYLLTTKKI